MIKSIMRALSASKQANNRGQGNNLYDCVTSGPVLLSMWEDNRSNRLKFTAYQVAERDGRDRRLRSIDAAMIPDVVEAVQKLSGKYAEDERLSESVREALRAYHDVLKTVPACVEQEIASTDVHAGNSAAS